MQVLHVGGRDISGFSPERFIYLFEWQKDREAFCNIWLIPQMSSWPEIGPCWSHELRAASGASTWVAISQNVGHLLLLSWSLVGTWIKIRAVGTWMWDGDIHVVMWPAEHNASVTHKYLSCDLLLCRLCKSREMDGKQNRTWLVSIPSNNLNTEKHVLPTHDLFGRFQMCEPNKWINKKTKATKPQLACLLHLHELYEELILPNTKTHLHVCGYRCI